MMSKVIGQGVHLPIDKRGKVNSMDDYTLTIEEVSLRLNKSTRTIHRYKDSGRLSYRAGTTQGNPLLFSKAEVEALERELSPRASSSGPWADPRFWERME